MGGNVCEYQSISICSSICSVPDIYYIYMYSTYTYTAAGSLFESYYIVFIYNVSLKNERLLKKVVLLSARV